MVSTSASVSWRLFGGQHTISTVRAALRPSWPTMAARMPSMSDVSAITAAMPITMPRMVSRLRTRLARSAEPVS